MEYPGRTTDMSQVTNKMYHIMLYQIHFTMSGMRSVKSSGVHGYMYANDVGTVQGTISIDSAIMNGAGVKYDSNVASLLLTWFVVVVIAW